MLLKVAEFVLFMLCVGLKCDRWHVSYNKADYSNYLDLHRGFHSEVEEKQGEIYVIRKALLNSRCSCFVLTCLFADSLHTIRLAQSFLLLFYL